MDWQRLLMRTVTRVEGGVDRAKGRLGRALRPNRVARIVPYRGFGTPDRVWVRGRVLYGDPPPPSTPEDRWWQNLANAYRRLESDEVPGARVRVRFQDAQTDVQADGEGHFRATIPVARPLPDAYWHEARIELLEPSGQGARAGIAIPNDPEFGVISDLDDTVINSGVRKVIRLVLEVLLGNAHSRIPFPGVGAFYRALHAAGQNPIFYVSSSPWNLYDVLDQFFELHRIPVGPMDLRDWGFSADEILPTRHGAHKRDSIDRILNAYPDLPFLLVGDSGQEDPEIYRDVVHDHPERVLGIYIRNVTPEQARRDAVRALADEVAAHNVDLVLADHTLTAARHAAHRGWIEPGAVEDVVRDRDREEADFPD